MTTPTYQVRRTLDLLDQLADGTTPTTRLLGTVAAHAGVTEKTVRRWMRTRTTAPAMDGAGAATLCASSAPRVRWTPSEDELAVISGSPNLMSAYRDLAAAGIDVPSYETFRRSVGRLDSGIAAAVTRRGGADALRNFRVYLTVRPEQRNQRWAMDAQEVPVRIRGDRGQLHKCWQTTAIDEATRMVMGTVITATRPTAEDVAACIAIGIRGRELPDGTFVGGVPEQIVWDNGGEFLADRITELALTLAFTGTAVTPFAPYEKGKIEAWHRTIQTELFDVLPGATHGPRTFSQQPVWEGAERTLLSEELLVAHTLTWVEQYNETRAHTALNGRSPLQAWQADATPLRRVGDDALYDAMLVSARPRKVTKNGLRFDTVDYIAPELNGMVGRHLTVRYLPHHRDTIDLFDGATHIATATAAHKLSGEQRQELLRLRNEQYRQAKALMTEGARRRTERFAQARADQLAPLGPLAAVAPIGERDENVAALAALLGMEIPAAQPAVAPAPRRRGHRARKEDDA